MATVVPMVVLYALLALTQSAATLPRHAAPGAGVIEKDGMRITFIRPGSAADRGRLHVDDVIVTVGSVAVHTSTEFLGSVKAVATGGPIKFEIRRGSAKLSLPITLDPAPDEHDPDVKTLHESVSIDGTLRRTLLTIHNGQEVHVGAGQIDPSILATRKSEC